MRKVLCFLAVLALIAVLVSSCDSGPSQYEKDLRSGMSKLGDDTQKMTKGEEQAVNDYLNWLMDQGG